MRGDCNRLTIPAAIVAVGFVVLGCVLRSAVIHFKDSERVVSVKGLAEREVAADRVIWPICYKLASNDNYQIYENVERFNKVIIDFLTAGGIDAKEISISPVEMFDAQAQPYNTQSIFRYSLTTTITVASSNVELVRELMNRQGELVKSGVVISADYGVQTQFLYSDLNSIKPEMIEEATKNARISAEKFASDSDSNLGKIKKANQGQFSITDRDANTPYIKCVRVVTSIDYYLQD